MKSIAYRKGIFGIPVFTWYGPVMHSFRIKPWLKPKQRNKFEVKWMMLLWLSYQLKYLRPMSRLLAFWRLGNEAEHHEKGGKITHQELQDLHDQNSTRRSCHWACYPQPCHFHLWQHSCYQEVLHTDSQWWPVRRCNPTTINHVFHQLPWNFHH
jgi:hypothetical protein